jgi:hypothetical protein
MPRVISGSCGPPLERFQQHWIHPQTPIKNFYLTGSDVVTAGVGGALIDRHADAWLARLQGQADD